MSISRSLLGLAVLLGISAVTYSVAQPAPARELVPYDVDSGHSIVIFKIRHLDVANFYGTFDSVTGEIQYDADNPTKSSVKVEIDTTSIDSNSKDRDELLMSSDFFDSGNHKSWTFESTGVKKGKKDAMQLMGKLTLRGVEKEIEAELVPVGEGKTFMGERVGFEARFSIDRNDFEISGVPGGLGADVDVIVALEGLKREG